MTSRSPDPGDASASEPQELPDGLWWTLFDDELLIVDSDAAQVLRLEGETARQVAHDLERSSTTHGINRRSLIAGAAAIAGVTWLALPSAAAASSEVSPGTGGTVERVGGYWVHTFTTDGTFTIPTARDVEYLVVAGGGGGGGGASVGDRAGGGGGAGGLLHNIGSPTSLGAGAYAITVGTGGAGGEILFVDRTSPGYGAPGADGLDSSLGTVVTAKGGGGGGGNRINASDFPGRAGGSGGGGGGGTGGATAGGAAESEQGSVGGAGSGGAAGGGGGAGGAGGAAASGVAGAAGAGLELSITGTPTTYADGGPAGTFTVNSPTSTAPGSGGAGGSAAGTVGSTTKRGEAGRDGVVIVRYLAVA